MPPLRRRLTRLAGGLAVAACLVGTALVAAPAGGHTALNPQPLPPRDALIALNPQPLPPRDSRPTIKTITPRALPPIGG